MGKLMKFLYFLMFLVLAVLGAVFVAVGLGERNLLENIFYYLNDPVYRNVVLGIGIALLVFALILLIVIIKNRSRGFDVLIEDEKGSVLITKKSLESAMVNATKRFSSCEPIKAKATIVDNEKIESRLIVDYYSDEDATSLSEKIRTEVISSLSRLTGIEDINLDLRLDKKEKQREMRENG